ncbi:isoaspartyl peptidase/L-asparaginase family protein [Erwinia pyrifoliae]|uniref:Isoaspartyl peptidase/L-asparaginase n=2 Tax=Erwinia pyrifoliae TaxID=79967 RepID=A0ABY5X4E7_ERWPY|nr:isoaspartyl peptidase/L-asparaginase [Erwinia pyrifoliae]MCT2388479.1 isoaspartyl peptidase/L-asparaginase [Erwinia pyrifoliae]UWS30535.1 isoaspartyl peptidase/L-asparaginase [Erwinia pyrifoliae]UWS32246.1 isoaspartyl peptidase/L-asparaginase [Erwinia pyrifoliae]
MAKATIAIHGGAGAIARASMDANKEQHYRQALSQIIAGAQASLAAGQSALDVVTGAVRQLEECPLFNAGRGAVFTHQGHHELDACIMDGRTRAAGAVAGVTRVRNPVLAARAVLENSPHVLFISEGAESFAAAQGLEMVENHFFSTPQRRAQLESAIAAGQMRLDHDGDPIDPDRKFGTVGAVACDGAGNLAAATSTGGITNKQFGRVGDSPLPGAGCYASAGVAVSCTGSGEVFMRLLAAYDVAALMEYGGLSLEQAAHQVIMQKIPALGGSGGLIAVDAAGNLALPFNSEGMYRAYGVEGEAPVVAIYQEEP